MLVGNTLQAGTYLRALTLDGATQQGKKPCISDRERGSSGRVPGFFKNIGDGSWGVEIVEFD